MHVVIHSDAICMQSYSHIILILFVYRYISPFRHAFLFNAISKGKKKCLSLAAAAPKAIIKASYAVIPNKTKIKLIASNTLIRSSRTVSPFTVDTAAFLHQQSSLILTACMQTWLDCSMSCQLTTRHRQLCLLHAHTDSQSQSCLNNSSSSCVRALLYRVIWVTLRRRLYIVVLTAATSATN